jgi:tetratricopeptide (TPR) repeat protein
MSRFQMNTLAAGLGLALMSATSLSAAPATEFFDPLLSDAAALCGPTGMDQRKLFAFYQKIAAAAQAAKAKSEPKSEKTETKSEPKSDPPVFGASADAPLYDNLGSISFKVTTKRFLAQRYFDQGLRLAYAFNHPEARRAFRTAQKHDPDCAMCYWGEALVLGPNINAPMDQPANLAALAAIKQAKEKAKDLTPREQALIAALDKRYSGDAKAERAKLDAAYAEAMEEAAKRFPDDADVQVLAAEAMMDQQPWDYWEAEGTKPKGKTRQVVALLEKTLDSYPEHAGAIHYYIHMMEASATPAKAEPFARRLASTMPGAGHLVHMPFHIYYRTGDYKAAVAANRSAAAIDEAYIKKESPTGIYPAAYYSHNVHSLMASAQMAGDGKSAVAAAEKLARIVSPDIARQVAQVQPIMASPYYAHAQFSTPDVILKLAAPADDLPYVKAMWHYARGVALAAKNDVAGARTEAQALATLKSGKYEKLVEAGTPAPDVLALAHEIVLARIALAENKLDDARAAFERAVKLQDGLTYTEPPHWYYPVRQSLGAVLVRLGKLDAAEEVFRESLARAPNNGWALYGLSEVYRRSDQKAAHAAAQKRLEKAWAGSKRDLDLARL